eukprot:CAMPEP_0118708616 /NCGR_PEP_ID=MMETSP0800-20121206/22018_1 /TAXON_ID=210618 ORGANISM="Striatella unipunctata, Strain CCMP2910" /NCGR_SAMPLE_ID=MMETSP0800 /ASSEMBLY_ACC=CAM_ASM_000638 /LENGTH=367 /DNA_ID=CAMNT_0006611893 /DNA_START=153 /DNA_END=1256 /DNA_ORIENTATION=+
MWEAPPIAKLQEALASPNHPIGMRMRSAYFLRQEYENAKKNGSLKDEGVIETVLATLSQGLLLKDHGALMRHEFAYVMGQLRDERCCDTLEQVLQNGCDDTMVRHEAAEALGAIGAERSLKALEKTTKMENIPVELVETCSLAIEFMKWKLNGGKDDDIEAPPACACMISPYSSIDPAPPHPAHQDVSTSDLGDLLSNKDEPLFARYRAMFSLRNRGGEDAVRQLCRALTEDKSSALLRHEVAYVLGQMQHPCSLEALEESLRRADEHEMVRHESAEALGSIEGRWEECEAVLNGFLNDRDVVVRESCMVALDAADYWGNCTNSEEGAELVEETFGKQKSALDGKITDENEQQNNRMTILGNHFNIS